jgi:hypothetical protein
MDPRKEVHEDVFDPTTDPRHRPATELPGEDPDTARPRDASAETPPPGTETVPRPAPPPDRPDRPS